MDTIKGIDTNPKPAPEAMRIQQVQAMRPSHHLSAEGQLVGFRYHSHLMMKYHAAGWMWVVLEAQSPFRCYYLVVAAVTYCLSCLFKCWEFTDGLK